MAGEIEAVKKWPQATKDYIDELKLEMRRVTWPNRKQVEATTTVVIICVFAFAAYFRVIDLIIDSTVTRTITALSRH
jgi:preprotein translocase subunit SecE